MTNKTLIELVEEYGEAMAAVGRCDMRAVKAADALLTEIKSRLASMQGAVVVPEGWEVDRHDGAIRVSNNSTSACVHLRKGGAREGFLHDFFEAMLAAPSLRTLTAEEWESPAWRAVIDKIVPAIDREGLNEDEHCCEWSLCMDRDRIRRELLAVLPDDWIAVSERLPEPGKMVLCLIQFMEGDGDGDYRHVVTHDFGETRVTEHGDYISPHCFQSHVVTHWMPLRGAPNAAIAKQEGGLAQGNEG